MFSSTETGCESGHCGEPANNLEQFRIYFKQAGRQAAVKQLAAKS